jgi:hypothetical protein
MEPLRLLVELLAGLLASSLCLLDLSPRNLPGSWFGYSLDNWLALWPLILSPPNLLTPFGWKGITMILLCDDSITLMSLVSLQSPITASKIHIISLLSITSQNCDAMALGARFEAMVIILKVYSRSSYKHDPLQSRHVFQNKSLTWAVYTRSSEPEKCWWEIHTCASSAKWKKKSQFDQVRL